jgi:transposase-like protein
MTNLLKNPIFKDEAKARAWLEARVWPNGPICAHCGNSDPEKITKLEGKAHRPGLYQCNEPECREQFTVTVGTVFERSKIPLTKWLAALFLITASKKGMSTHQMHRMLGISYKSTWFMTHRLREAMRVGGLEPLGGAGKIVEADETYIADSEKKIFAATRKRNQVRPTKNIGPHYKRKVLALVERGGDLRSFHVDEVTSTEVAQIIRKNVSRESAFMTDEGRHYRQIGSEFASHERVHHTAKEYVRGDVHVNTLEGYFSIFKRGMKGVYQHCGEQHLHRYLAEFDFRYNTRTARGFTDADRAELAAKGIVGKRLTYRRPHEAPQA